MFTTNRYVEIDNYLRKLLSFIFGFDGVIRIWILLSGVWLIWLDRLLKEIKVFQRGFFFFFFSVYKLLNLIICFLFTPRFAAIGMLVKLLYLSCHYKLVLHDTRHLTIGIGRYFVHNQDLTPEINFDTFRVFNCDYKQ